MQAGEAVGFGVNMGGRYGNQVRAAIQAAVEGEVRPLGIHPVIVAVVGQHADQVLFLQRVGNVHLEIAVAAVVAAQMPAVHIHVGGGVHRREVQQIAFGLGQLGFGQLLHIAGCAAPEIRAAVLAVNAVPGVGQVHKVPVPGERGGRGGNALAEHPFMIQ